MSSSNSKAQWQEGVEYAKSLVPAGEELVGVLVGMEDWGTIKKLLHRYVLGYFATLVATYPQTFTVVLTNHSLVFVGYKKTRILTSYEVDCSFVRPFSEVSYAKRIGKCVLTVKNDDGKNTKITLANQADLKLVEKAFS